MKTSWRGFVLGVIIGGLAGVLTGVVCSKKNREVSATRKPDRYDALREANKDSEKTGVTTYLMPEGVLLSVSRKQMISDVRGSLDRSERVINRRFRKSDLEGIFSADGGPHMIPAYLDMAVERGSYLQDAELTEKLKALRWIFVTTDTTSRTGSLDPKYLFDIRQRLDMIEASDRSRQQISAQ